MPAGTARGGSDAAASQQRPSEHVHAAQTCSINTAQTCSINTTQTCRFQGTGFLARRAQTCVDSPCHASDAEVRTLRGRSARGGPRDRGGGASGVQKQDLGSGQFLNGGGLGSGVQKCNGSGFRSDSCKSGSCVFQPVLELRAVSAISISQLRTVIRFRKGARFRGCRCFSKPRFQVLIPNLQPHPEFQTQLPQKKKPAVTVTMKVSQLRTSITLQVARLPQSSTKPGLIDNAQYVERHGCRKCIAYSHRAKTCHSHGAVRYILGALQVWVCETCASPVPSRAQSTPLLIS